MNIVIFEARQFQDRWAHVGVVGPGGIHAKVLNAGAHVTNPRGGDLVLDVAVIPGKAVVGPCRNEGARARRGASRWWISTGCEEEPVRIGERREGWRPER